MAEHTTDDSVLQHIEQLVAEEQDLYRRAESGEGTQQRLRRIQTELDQCWDLLRQRRALREFDRNPDRAAVRPESVVEKYEQ